MPKDALHIYRAAQELDCLIGGKIDKVNMPDKETLLFLVHTKSGNSRLILSCNPSLPRAHITTRKYSNAEVASGTLMYFRKRLSGAYITDIVKDKTERMFTILFSARDELLQPVKYSLAVELTGKCSNIVFIENGIIQNALRKVTSEAEGKRAVLIGLPYTPPNPTGRISTADKQQFITAVKAQNKPVYEAIDSVVAGLSKTTTSEIFLHITANSDDEIINQFIDKANDLYSMKMRPVVTYDGNCPLDFYLTPFTSCGEQKFYPTLNEAMDAYYSALFDKQEKSLLVKPLKNAISSAEKKNKRRVVDATATLLDSENAEENRIFGEIITANIYRINKGDKTLSATNWYDGKEVAIPLDESKSPSQNAAKYFKLYTKKKKAALYAEEAKQKATQALDALEGIKSEIELCTTKQELNEVKQELIDIGLMRAENKKKKQEPPSTPYEFIIDGVKLLVGKNHSQNERITKSADKTFTWLHVKQAHGSHGVLCSPNPTAEQLSRAAEIVAYYSTLKNSDNAEVDYTLIKYVHLKGGGRAEYTDYKTLFVKPKN